MIGLNPRSWPVKILLLGVTFSLLLVLYWHSDRDILSNVSFPRPPPPSTESNSNSKPAPAPAPISKVEVDIPTGRCPPRAYANGRWTGPHYRNEIRNMTQEMQAFEFSGFEGCAKARGLFWYLASDNMNQWDRFPKAHSYKWTVGPDDGCEGLQELNREKMLQDMVQQGGWLLLGDSITEGQFFSLSCILYPHVIATPTGFDFDRDTPENLFLNPQSPLIEHMFIPDDFDIEKTPLVTFRRGDLLMTKEELERIHANLHPDTVENFSLFSDEGTWNMSPTEFLPLFLDNGYSTLVVSTGGHWTTSLFGGYLPDRPPAFEGAKPGLEGVIDLFEHAIRKWAGDVQSALDARKDIGGRKRQVLVRAYLPGHNDCHNIKDIWREVNPEGSNLYNWGQIWRYNDIFERILSERERYPDVHFLSIDRPGRLRPDAHTTSDCLHIMTGAGVMEGWSHYIWHYVSKELGRGRHSRVHK